MWILRIFQSGESSVTGILGNGNECSCIPEPLNLIDGVLIPKIIVIIKIYRCLYTRLRITNATPRENKWPFATYSTQYIRFAATKRTRL